MERLSDEIQKLIDKDAIRDLVNIYCRAADRHDHVLMRSLYHDDATDDHGVFFKGSAMEFIDTLPSIQKDMLILHHNVTTHNIEFISETKAEGETYILAFHQVKGEMNPFDVLIGGRYFDVYEKREGAWKFLSRAVDADWVYTSDHSKVDFEHPMVQGCHRGVPGLEDPLYKMLSSAKFLSS